MRHFRLFPIKRRSKALLSLSAVILIYTFATSILQYNLVLFTDSLAKNYTLLGVMMGLPWLLSILTDMPAGAFADRFGRKRTMVLGLLGLGASGILFYLVSGLIQLFWVMVIFGAFEGFLTVAGFASIIATSPKGEENRFVGAYSSASEFGYFIGPLAGGVAVAWFGDKIPFLIFGFLCFAIALLAHLLIKESHYREDEPFKTAIRNIFKKDHLYTAEFKEFFSAGRLALLTGSFMLLGGMIFEFIWVMEPVFINSLRVSPVIGGIILSVFAAPFFLLDYVVGRWIDRTQKRFAAIVFGLLLGGGSVILFGLASNPLALIVFAAMVSIGYVFFYVAVNGLFDSFSDHHRRGYMTGVWQSIEDVGFMLGPIFGGVLADFFGLRGAFIFFGFLSLFVIFWAFSERKNIKKFEYNSAAL